MGFESGEEIRLLHTEDDAAFAELTGTYLEREDERICLETASNASEALELLAEEPFDCVVSDYDMPGMNGLEFLKTVRERYPTLPFILFTGKGSEEVASEAISAGVSDYLQKDTGTEQYELLANRIRNHVDRTRAQRDLEQREAHLRQAQAVGDIGSWQVDLSETRSNPAEDGYSLFGVSDDETVSFEWELESVHPADKADVDEAWRAALECGEFDVRHRIITDDGETRWLRVQADIQFDEEGAPSKTVGVVQDITTRMEREQELRLFREAVEAAGHCIYWTDTDGEIEYVNPAFEETTGYTAEEAVGQNPRILQSDEHESVFFENLWETITGGDTWQNEVTNVTKDGERYVVNQTIAPVKGETGEIEYFVAVNADITDRKEREQQLREERDRRVALFQNPSDSIVEIEFDEETPIIKAANDRFFEVFGFESDDIVGRPVPDVLVPEEEDSQTHHDEIKRQVLQGEPVETTVRRQTRRGPRDFLMRVFPIDVANGHRGSYAIYTDITDGPEQADFLEPNSDLLEQLFAQVPTHLFLKDKAGRHLWISDYYDDAPPVQQARGKTNRELYPESGDETYADDMRVIETGESISNKEEYLPSFGHWNLTSKVPWYDDSGNVQGLIGVSHEITERKASEETLREERKFFEQAFNAIDDIFYVISPDGTLDRINDQACEVTGYSKDELLSMDSTDFVSESDRDRVERDVREAFETGRSKVEAGLVTKDGETIPHEFRKHRLVDPDGTVIGVGGIGRDITERKQRERELEQQNERLDEFTSIVSHDLQSPLSVAQGRLELVKDDCSSAHLDDVAEALDRMDDLIEGLLTLAKEGDKIGETEPVSLADTAESCWRTIETDEASLAIDTDLTIRADRSRLRQLLENLARNAIEHGGDDVTVTVGEVADGFYVADDGDGIPDGERERVLEPGYSPGEAGTGLGLSIVAQIADAHGWEVTIAESDVTGARFEFTDVETVS